LTSHGGDSVRATQYLGFEPHRFYPVTLFLNGYYAALRKLMNSTNLCSSEESEFFPLITNAQPCPGYAFDFLHDLRRSNDQQMKGIGQHLAGGGN
jgi:hypothetical protein